MRKTLLLSLALAVLVLAFGSLVAAQDAVTIRLWGHGSSPAEEAALNEQIAAFEEAFPDIDVELLISPEYDTQLQAAFASGDYPEVFYVNQDKVDEFVDAGVLAAADDQVEEVDDIYPSLVQTFSYNGTFYCPAKDFSNLTLEYNADLFDEAGVEYPTADWTWDDLRAASEQITEATGTPAFVVELNIDRWLAFYVQAGGTFYDEEGNFVFGSEGENADAAVAAMDFFVSLFADGLAVTPQDVGAGWSGEAFGNGAAAMTMEGNWIIQFLLDSYPDLNWGSAELPAGSGGEGTLTFSECYGVAADNAHPEESWQLVNFLTNREGAARVADGGFGVMPARASAADAWLEARGEEYEPFVAGSANAVAPVLPPGFQEFRDTLTNGLVGAVEGSNTSEEAIEDAREVAAELLEE
jgi:multiple sugar transport system substrate-binding protein